MSKYGIKFMGYEPMFNGRTGEEYNAMICICPTYYMRLQKFSTDSVHSIARGAVNPLTHQPLKGRNVDGGLRMGEMEKDALTAHGSMNAFYEKFYQHSDKYMRYICRNCGLAAIYNNATEQYMCKICVNKVDITAVSSSWVTNVIDHNLKGSHVLLRWKPKRLTFYDAK
jgi:DNA-directed RNA polymerase beta subunit